MHVYLKFIADVSLITRLVFILFIVHSYFVVVE